MTDQRIAGWKVRKNAGEHGEVLKIVQFLRGIATVHLSVTLMCRGRIGWVSSSVITRVISPIVGNLVQGNTPKIRVA